MEHRPQPVEKIWPHRALREVGDKGDITLKKVVVEEAASALPRRASQKPYVASAPWIGRNMEKGQGHTPAVRIAMAGPVEFFSQCGLYPQLFCQLTSQADRLIPRRF